MKETAYTRAIRRAQHDTYAPFAVRPAMRRDAFERSAPLWNYVFGVAVLIFVAQFLRWAFWGW